MVLSFHVIFIPESNHISLYVVVDGVRLNGHNFTNITDEMQ